MKATARIRSVLALVLIVVPAVVHGDSGDTIKAIKAAALDSGDKQIKSALDTLDRKGFLYKIISIVEEGKGSADSRASEPPSEEEIQEAIEAKIREEHARTVVARQRFSHIEWNEVRTEKKRKVFSGRYVWDANNLAGHDSREFQAKFDPSSNEVTEVTFGPEPRRVGRPGVLSLSGD